MLGLSRGPIFRISMPTSDTNHREAQMKPNKWCRRRGEWRLSVRENCATIIKSSNIIEVGHPLPMYKSPICQIPCTQRLLPSGSFLSVKILYMTFFMILFISPTTVQCEIERKTVFVIHLWGLLCTFTDWNKALQLRSWEANQTVSQAQVAVWARKNVVSWLPVSEVLSMERDQPSMPKMAASMKMEPHAQQIRGPPRKTLMLHQVRSEDTRLLPLSTSILKLARRKTRISKMLPSPNPLQQHRLQVNNDLALTAHPPHHPILPALAYSNLLLNSLVELRLPPPVGPHHAKEERLPLAAWLQLALDPVVKLLTQL